MKAIGKDILLNALGVGVLAAGVVIAIDVLDVDLTKVIDLNLVVKGIARLK